MKLIFRSPLKSWGFGNIQVTLTWKHQCPDEKAQSWDLAWAFWLATNPSTPDHCPSPIALLACELSASVEHNFLLLFSHSVVSDFCDPMDCSMPGFPVLHYLLEFAQTHVHWEDGAIQASHPLSHCCSLCPHSFPAPGSFPVSQLFTPGGQSIGAAVPVSVLLMNIQDWFPLGLTCLISLQSKGFSRVFSNTMVQKHQLFDAQSSLWSNSHIHTWPLGRP